MKWIKNFSVVVFLILVVLIRESNTKFASQTFEYNTTSVASQQMIQYPLKHIAFNQALFYSEFFRNKGFVGIEAWSLSSSTTAAKIFIPSTDLLNATRFHLTGNNTANFSLLAKESLVVADLPDILQIVQSLCLAVNGNYSVIEWRLYRNNHVWCPTCERYISVKRGYSYEDLWRSTSKFMFLRTAIAGDSGLTVWDSSQNDFLVAHNLSGLVCGKYSTLTSRWEWGCYPAVNQQAMVYTNWAQGEPSYQNDSACTYINMYGDGKWHVVTCGDESIPSLWQSYILQDPTRGFITIAAPLRLVTPQSSTFVKRTVIPVVVPDPSNTTTGPLVDALKLDPSIGEQFVLYVSDGISKQGDLAMNRSLLNASVFWAKYRRTDQCTVVDPVRGLCHQICSGVNRSSNVVVASPYDLWLFGDKNSMMMAAPTGKGLSVSAVGDGYGLYHWNLTDRGIDMATNTVLNGRSLSAFPLWNYSLTTNRTEPTLWNDCVALRNETFWTYNCGDEGYLTLCSRSLTPENFGTFEVVSKPRPSSIISQQNNNNNNGEQQVQTTTTAVVSFFSAAAASTSAALMPASCMVLMSEICNDYSPLPGDEGLSNMVPSSLFEGLTQNQIYRYVNVMFLFVVLVSIAVLDGGLFLYLRYFHYREINSLLYPRISIQSFLLLMPRLVSSSLFLAVHPQRQVHWVWVIFLACVLVIVVLTFHVVKNTVVWAKYDAMQMAWSDAAITYHYCKKYGFLFDTYRQDRVWFVSVEFMISFTFAVMSGIPTDQDSPACRGIFITQAVLIGARFLAILGLRPSAADLCHRCDVVAALLFLAAVVLRAISLPVGWAVTGLCMLGCVVSTVPLVVWIVCPNSVIRVEAEGDSCIEEERFLPECIEMKGVKSSVEL
eukprot:PhF_6_TR13393/c0_g1_i2/m.21280